MKNEEDRTIPKIEELFVSHYALELASPAPGVAPTHGGFLIRVHFKSGEIGYADVHPWPTLGDLPVSEQEAWLTRLLSDPKETEPQLPAQLRRSLQLAWIDGSARARGESLWTKCGPIPPSHFFLNDRAILTDEKKLSQIRAQGFDVLKMKIGASRTWADEVATLKKGVPLLRQLGLRLRLDANHQLSPEKTSELLGAIPSPLDWIDFLEDPFPYDQKAWSGIKSRWGISLALDRWSPLDRDQDLTACDALVIKPAIQDPRQALDLSHLHNLKIIFTTYLDHALGVLSATWEAARMNSLSNPATCGLLSHSQYRTDLFFEKIRSNGPFLIPPHEGTGFGLDVLLKNVSWQKRGTQRDE